MHLDISTERVSMRPEWDDLIAGWVEHCRRYHPVVSGVDIRLRHRDDRQPAVEVEAVASAGRRRLRATREAVFMGAALHDALDALEDELLVHEAVHRAA